MLPLLPIERKWIQSQSRINNISCPMISIAGTTGVGKTSLIHQFADIAQVYLEDVTKNPFFNATPVDGPVPDVASSQLWFIDTMLDFAHTCSFQSPLILDQDPAAIVLVYSRLFLEDGLLSIASYEAQIEKLLAFEDYLNNWQCPRTVIFLDADEQTLKSRLCLRSNGFQDGPDIAWLQKIRSRFHQILPFFPRLKAYRTETQSVTSIASDIRRSFDV